jgi:formylglycine-generating enzyme required for sulfatase activity
MTDLIDARSRPDPSKAAPGPPPASGMTWVPGGEFTMGSQGHYPEEAPAHRVAVDGFWMDIHPVTNDEFAAFVEATGHVTVAELPPDAADYPGADPSLLVPASAVFTPPKHRVDLRNAYEWWSLVPGSQWRHPRGPGTSIAGLGAHPVTHVAWPDVAAYAAWAAKTLPTEAEWEFAARGGGDDTEYAWGAELTPGGEHRANVWQGDFPLVNLAADGYEWTSPVGSFPPNGYEIVDMIGNVWEWTADWYSAHPVTAEDGPSCCGPPHPRANPGGGTQAASVEAGASIPRKVMKGGSYLCAPNYCRRYRPAARLPQPIDTSTCHLGFRCVVRPSVAAAG